MTERDPNLVKYERRVIGAAFAMFGLFFVLSMAIGGDAINGRIENGVYYVSSHGRDTAVSGGIYYLSMTVGSLALGAFFLVFIYKLIRAMMYGRQN